MMQRLVFAAMVVISSLNVINAECANACNGHGKCTSYDMCICNRNWQASDCSERVCQFGLAHVDSPKGDLDMSGDIAGADTNIAENSFVYPYGTTEQFPAVQNSDLSVLQNTAHYYMECSNKGTCDRSSGECSCYDGFDGAACQRTSCPNTCSGHGVCKTIEALAKADNQNIYKLWDRQTTMGCECDAGYYGPDCSLRDCKQGVDPLYFDDSTTVKYSIYNFAIVSNGATSGTGGPETIIFHDGRAPFTADTGTFAIRFFDAHGEDWLTGPIKAGASCSDVVAALEALPNNVIPKGFTLCNVAVDTSGHAQNGAGSFFPSITELDYDGTVDPFEKKATSQDNKRSVSFRTSFWDAVFPNSFADAIKNAQSSGATSGYPSSYDPTTTGKVFGYIYRIKFFGNPGKLKQPQIEIYLDGKRPSIQSFSTLTNAGKTAVITRVWTDGQQGESDDYFADHCDGVTVSVRKFNSTTDISFDPYGAPYPVTYSDRTFSYLYVSPKQIPILKTCLGGSDDDETNNVDVYNWDYGNAVFPHIIKLVRGSTTYTDGGYYVALVYDTKVICTGSFASTPSTCTKCNGAPCAGVFRLVNPFESLDNDQGANALGTDQYEVYTTRGTLALTTAKSKSQSSTINNADGLSSSITTTEAIFGFASNEIIMTTPSASASSAAVTPTDGSVSCEHVDTAIYLYCLNKTDIFTLLHLLPGNVTAINNKYVSDYSTTYFNSNPKFINFYTAMKLSSKTADYSLSELFVGSSSGSAATTGINKIVTDISTNWASSLTGRGITVGHHPQFQIYKFIPSPVSTYKYVAQCSNRGVCDSTTGTCSCFSGYSSDACQEQNSLAV